MKEFSIDYEIGFADSNIISYNIQDENIVLILECWNNEILEIVFFKYAAIFAMNYTQISDFREAYESVLLERVLTEFYEVKPLKHNFRIFKFLNSDEMTALEIICENIKINKTST